MWVLSGSYQGERNFTFDSLAGARNRRQAWRERIALCYQKEIAGDERVFSRILEAVNNNLNSAEAFAIIDTSQLSLDDWSKVDELFGLKLLENTPDLAEETYALISRRTEAKKARDFKTADEIRDELSEMGIGLRDNQEGSYWYYL